jgi:hypothetical protein
MTDVSRRKVFVGSTKQDLLKHRAKVRAAIESLGFEPLMMEKEFEASDSDAVGLSLQKVEQADIYIGIYAHRYGHVPTLDNNPQGLSITELEYNHADSLNLPCLLFVIDETAKWDPLSVEGDLAAKGKLAAFKERIGKKHTWKIFDEDADALAEQVKIALLANPEKVEVPYAVFAMTSSEFEDLWGCSDEWLEKCDARRADKKKISELHGNLEKQGLDHERLVASYCTQRRDWKPLSFSDSQETENLNSIDDIIAGIVKGFNSLQSDKLYLVPRDFSDQLLSDDEAIRAKASRDLQETGCVIFVDAISLFHPVISSRFESSRLGMQQNTPIVFVLPFNITWQPVNRILDAHIRKVGQGIPLRFTDDMDILCELNATNQIQLKRWFKSILPNVSDQLRRKRVNIAKREAIRKLAEKQQIKTTGGMVNVI